MKKTDFSQKDGITNINHRNPLNKNRLSSYDLDIIFNNWWLSE